MAAVFLKLVNMSITASWLVLAVILLRLILKKAPKFISCILWALVGVRLVLPFSFESILSLIPSSQPIPQEFITTPTPSIQSGVTYVDNVINPIIADSLAPQIGASVNPTQVLSFVAAVVWILGMVGMITYTVISYLRIHNKVREAAPLRNNILICDRIDTPFILGVVSPKIYLPSSMSEADMEFVVAHEKAHLKRHDHLWKPLGFALLTVYWFNPILWVAYVLLCRDIEFACDEKVVKELGSEIKKPYSDALINCSVKKKMISACPLAFGEVGVKDRIKSVLNYKKPAFWIIIVAVVLSVVAAVCFLTNPLQSGISSIKVTKDLSGKSFLVIDYSDITAYEASNGIDLYPIGENGGFVEELGKYHISVIALNGKVSEKLLKTYPTEKVHKLKNAPDGYNILIRYAEFTDLPMKSAIYIYIGSDSPISCVPEGKKEGELKSRGRIKIELQTGISESFKSAVAYVNYSDNSDLKEKSLNASALSDTVIQHYPIRKFESKQQLNKFMTDFANELSFDQRHDECPSFNEVTAKYNDSFFKDKVLFGIYISSGSGSYRFGVHRVYNNGQSFTVTIKQLNDPEVVTMDMAGWMAFVEIDRAAVKDCTVFDAFEYSEIFTKDPNSSGTIVDSSLFTDEFDVFGNRRVYFRQSTDNGNKVMVKFDDAITSLDWSWENFPTNPEMRVIDIDRAGNDELVASLCLKHVNKHIGFYELHMLKNNNGFLTDIKFEQADYLSQIEKVVSYNYDKSNNNITITVGKEHITYNISDEVAEKGEFRKITFSNSVIFYFEYNKIYVQFNPRYFFKENNELWFPGPIIYAEVVYDKSNGFVMKNFTLDRDTLYNISPTTQPTTQPTTTAPLTALERIPIDRFSSIEEMIAKAKTYKTLEDVYLSAGCDMNQGYYMPFSEQALESIFKDKMIIVPVLSNDVQLAVGRLFPFGYIFELVFNEKRCNLYICTYKEREVDIPKYSLTINDTEVFVTNSSYYWYFNDYYIEMDSDYMDFDEATDLIKNLSFTTIKLDK
ncbi:MAG: hypothetical protein IJF54_05955 [Clostridia bacterium]|nr:hypothetical protein [Clostridia bacterium]